MLTDDSTFIRTSINTGLIREYLLRTDNAAPKKAIHPTQSLKNSKPVTPKDDGKLTPIPLDVTQMPGYKPKLQKVLSHKALKLGEETGVTAEFIVQQTAEQLVGKIKDLFLLFDVFQEALYSNDPQARPISGKSGKSRKSEKSIKDVENRVLYEESILMTFLGPDYIKLINEETGEWIREEDVLKKFYELFETRIRYIFDAEEDDDQTGTSPLRQI